MQTESNCGQRRAERRRFVSHLQSGGIAINSFFDPENKFVNIMGKIGDLIILSFLWTLMSVTVVLSVGASAGMYYAVVKSVRSEYGTAFREMWRSFKRNLKQGALVSLMLAIYTALLIMGWSLSSSLLSSGSALAVAYWAAVRLLAVPLLLILPWLSALLARFTVSLKQLFAYAFILALKELKTTLLLLILLALSAFCVINIPFLTFIIPGCYTFAASFLIERVFKRYIKDDGDAENATWHLDEI